MASRTSAYPLCVLSWPLLSCFRSEYLSFSSHWSVELPDLDERYLDFHPHTPESSTIFLKACHWADEGFAVTVIVLDPADGLPPVDLRVNMSFSSDISTSPYPPPPAPLYLKENS